MTKHVKTNLNHRIVFLYIHNAQYRCFRCLGVAYVAVVVTTSIMLSIGYLDVEGATCVTVVGTSITSWGLMRKGTREGSTH